MLGCSEFPKLQECAVCWHLKTFGAITPYETGRTVRKAEPLSRISGRKAFPQAILVVVILRKWDHAFVSTVPFGGSP